jgi:hypothetical protein
MIAEDNLSDRLQADITWRVKELSEIVRSCKDAEFTRQEALLRASVPILYAHWEGYFVYAANCYLNYLTDKRLPLSILRDEFWALTVRKRVRPQQINGDISFSRFLMNLRQEKDRIFKKGNFERINGSSNLNSEVLVFCCAQIGLSDATFRSYFNFIDRNLIDKRNHIAHGSSLRFRADDVAIYRDNVVDLMRITQTAIENDVALTLYKKTP